MVKNVHAALVWMDQRPLQLHRRYLLKHTSQMVPAFVTGIDNRINVSMLTHEPAASLEMNGIGMVELHLLRPIAVDLYGENRTTGAFILIDAETNSTAAAGMIRAASGYTSDGEPIQAVEWGPVIAGEREARWGHRGGVVELSGPAELIDAVERSLFVVGAVTVRIASNQDVMQSNSSRIEAAISLLTEAGLLALVVRPDESDVLIVRCEGKQSAIDTDKSIKAVSAVHQILREAGILVAPERADL